MHSKGQLIRRKRIRGCLVQERISRRVLSNFLQQLVSGLQRLSRDRRFSILPTDLQVRVAAYKRARYPIAGRQVGQNIITIFLHGRKLFQQFIQCFRTLGRINAAGLQNSQIAV